MSLSSSTLPSKFGHLQIDPKARGRGPIWSSMRIMTEAAYTLTSENTDGLQKSGLYCISYLQSVFGPFFGEETFTQNQSTMTTNFVVTLSTNFHPKMGYTKFMLIKKS